MDRKQIRDLRITLGISQEGFARLLGVATQSVRRWEAGLARPLPILSLRLEELLRKTQQEASAKGGATVSEGGEKKAVIDLEIGGLGGLLKGIGGLLDLATQMAEEGKEETTRTGQVEALGGKVKGVYGVTVRLGLGGKPVIEHFGNVRETEKGTVVSETREPLVDVLDEGDRLTVIAELPGVEEKDIHVRVEGDMLEIRGAAGERKYSKEVLLPAAVDPQSLRSSYRNGVLEVRLNKR